MCLANSSAHEITRGLPKNWQPHCLRGIELWILKRRETNQAIDERRRQGAAIDVDLIAQNYLDPLRHHADDRLFGLSPRRRRQPRLILIIVPRKACAHNPTCGRRAVDQVGDISSAHAPEAGKESPLIIVWA
jgi:hypothetical protein